MNFPFFGASQQKNRRVFNYVVISYRLSDNRTAEGGEVSVTKLKIENLTTPEADKGY